MSETTFLGYTAAEIREMEKIVKSVESIKGTDYFALILAEGRVKRAEQAFQSASNELQDARKRRDGLRKALEL